MCGTLLPYYISVKENKCYRWHLYGDRTPQENAALEGQNCKRYSLNLFAYTQKFFEMLE